MSRHKEFDTEIKLKLTSEDKEMFQKICELKRWDMSTVIRQMIKKFNDGYKDILPEEPFSTSGRYRNIIVEEKPASWEEGTSEE